MPLLTPNYCSQILKKPLVLGDSYDTHADALRGMKFLSIDSTVKFYNKLADNQEQVALHQALSKDLGKEEFLNPFLPGELPDDSGISLLYKSPLIEEFRNEVKSTQRGRSPAAASSKFLILRYLSLSTEDKAKYDYEAWKEFFCVREREAEFFFPDAIPSSANNVGEVLQSGALIFENSLKPLGFRPGRGSAQKQLLQYKKVLSSDLALVFSIWHEVKWTNLVRSELGKLDRFEPHLLRFGLDLVDGKQSKSHVTTLKRIPINIYSFSPLRFSGFRVGSFSAYRNVRECAVAILGFVKFYEYFAKDIDAALV